MKILLISPSPPDYLGGISHFTRDLAKNLGKNNITVDYLCTSLTKNKSARVVYSKNVFLIKKKCFLLSDNRNFLRLKNPVFNVLSYLIKYGRNYDLIHVHSFIYFSTIQTFFYKIFLNRTTPIILHLHGGVQTSNFPVSNFKDRLLIFFKKYFFDLVIGKIMMKTANAVISVSKEDLLLVNQVFKVSRKRYSYYIPNVIDVNIFKKNPELKRKYLGFIGRLTLIKGIDLFLKLIEKYYEIDKNQEYLIIGEGPYLPDVKKVLKKYPITFFKRVLHEEMPNYYNQFSIFIQTSRTEGLPTCVLEALSSEIPVVASKVGGIAELIKNGITGYTFESGKIDSAIDKLLLIKENNSYEMLGKNGRALIEKNYSWDIITKKIIKIYENIISREKTVK
jgi:glycosyltransferase involved in cell wall biosynthesis